MDGKAWKEDFLDEMRKTGDQLADDTIMDLFEEGLVERVNEVLLHLIRHEGVLADELPQVVQTYLEKSAVLPVWADPQRIQKGQELFRDYGLIAFSILGCASLPACYAAGDAARVLWLTQRLEQHVDRRIVETGQMIVDVMSPGGLNPDGRGIRSAQKVRLMHAGIRHLVSTDPEAAKPNIPPKHFGDVLLQHKWKTDEWGRPINQSVMAGTLLTFSYVILRSLRKLGVGLSQEQEENYLHVWNVVGHVMGVNERFLMSADTYENAERLFNTILERNRDATKEAQAMTEAIINFIGGVIKKVLPFSKVLPVNHIPRMLIIEMVGKDLASFLGVRFNWVDRLGSGLMGRVLHLLGEFETDAHRNLSDTHQMAEWLFRTMANEMWKLPRGGKRDLFFIPNELADGWGLSQS
jgi:hypothetical protein